MKTSSILLALAAVAGVTGVALAASSSESKPATKPTGTPNVGPGVTPGTYPAGTGGVLQIPCQGISTLPEPLRTQVRNAIASGLSPVARETLAVSLDPVCPMAAAEVRAATASAAAPAPGAPSAGPSGVLQILPSGTPSGTPGTSTGTSTPSGPISFFRPPSPSFGTSGGLVAPGGGLVSASIPAPTFSGDLIPFATSVQQAFVTVFTSAYYAVPPYVTVGNQYDFIHRLYTLYGATESGSSAENSAILANNVDGLIDDMKSKGQWLASPTGDRKKLQDDLMFIRDLLQSWAGIPIDVSTLPPGYPSPLPGAARGA